MSVSQKYLKQSINKAIMQCLIWILFIVMLIDFVSQTQRLSDIYDWQDSIYYIFLMLPNRLQLCLPVIMLLSGFLSANHLHKSQEILALQTLGCSFKTIIKNLIMASSLVVIICCLIIETIGHKTLFKAKQLRSKQANLYLNKGGLWWWELENHKAFNHVKKIKDNGDLQEISIIKLSDKNKPTTIITAKKAFFTNKIWILQNVIIKEIASGTEHAHQQITTKWSLTPEVTKFLSQKDRMLNLKQLYNRWQFKKKSANPEEKNHAYNFFHRLYLPIFSILCFMLPWSCCLINLLSDRNKSKLLPCTGLGIIIYTLDIILKPLGQNMINLQFLIPLLPSLIIISLIVLYNITQWKQ